MIKERDIKFPKDSFSSQMSIQEMNEGDCGLSTEDIESNWILCFSVIQLLGIKTYGLKEENAINPINKDMENRILKMVRNLILMEYSFSININIRPELYQLKQSDERLCGMFCITNFNHKQSHKLPQFWHLL